MVGWWIEWDGGLGGMEENKKSASTKKNCAYGSPDSIVCIKGWHVPTCGFSPQPTLSEAHITSLAFSKQRFRLRLSLAWRVNHNMPSPMAGLLHVEIAGVVRRVMRVMRMLSALFPRLLFHIRASQGGAKRDGCYALLDGGARPSLTAFREG